MAAIGDASASPALGVAQQAASNSASAAGYTAAYAVEAPAADAGAARTADA